jgi:hypothetical protein
VQDSINLVSNDLTTFKTDVDSHFTTMQSDVDAQIQTSQTSLISTIGGVEENLNTKIDTTKTELTAQIGSATTTAATDLDTVKTDLESQMNTTKTDLASQIDSVQSELNTKIETTESNLSSQISDVSSDLSGEESARTTNDSTINDTLQAMLMRLSAIEDRVSNAYIKPSMQYVVPADQVVGETREFSVSTIANDAAGKMVRAYFQIPAEASVEYLEQDGNWYPLPDSYGPETGFPLSDLTSQFRSTFSAAGTYNVVIEYRDVITNEVVLAGTVSYTVNAV